MKRAEWLKEAKVDYADGFERHMWFDLLRWAGMPAKIYWVSLAEFVFETSVLFGDLSKQEARIWELLFLGENIYA